MNDQADAQTPEGAEPAGSDAPPAREGNDPAPAAPPPGDPPPPAEQKEPAGRAIGPQKLTERLAGRDAIDQRVRRRKILNLVLPLAIFVLAAIAVYPRVNYYILRYLATHGDIQSRVNAAHDLARLNDPSALDIYIEAIGLTKNKDQFVARVNEHFVEHPERLPIVIDMLSSEETSRRLGAIFTVYFSCQRLDLVAQHPEIRAKLEQTIVKDADFDCRLYAIHALRFMAAPSSLGPLVQASGETGAKRSPVIRRRAAEALTNLAVRHEATLPEVGARLVALLGDELPLVRTQALDGLRELAPPEARAAVQAHYEKSEKAEKAAALAALASYGLDSVRDLALDAAKHDLPSFRATAAAILALDDDPRSVAAVAGLLVDGDVEVRKFAVEALPQAKDPSKLAREILRRLKAARDFDSIRRLHRAMVKLSGRDGGPVPEDGLEAEVAEELVERWRELLTSGDDGGG